MQGDPETHIGGTPNSEPGGPQTGATMPLPQEFIDRVLAIADTRPGKKEFIRMKMDLAKEMRIGFIPSDIMILTCLTHEQFDRVKDVLLTKPVRTGSGVTVIAVMTKPLPCPHGKCTYCPGGPGSFFGDVPQSYTGHEPATMRGIRSKYDIYAQIFTRLEQYIVSGHNPEKVELILMGGTFPSYDKEYQDEVISDAYQAMDDFSDLFYDNHGNDEKEVFLFEKFKEFFQLPGSVHDKLRARTLLQRILTHKENSPLAHLGIAELQRRNETATIRCVGLTIETRPSHARAEHAQRMLEQGCTRVELGVQTTFDDVLTAVHRDHTVQDTAEAIADLRDLGFKMNFHVMLGLPGMDATRDMLAARMLFDDPRFRPDMLKIYPCMVMPGTPLYYDWKRGKYTPYSTQQAAEVIAQVKRIVPRYVRIMRVQRDIPTKVTSAGVGLTNLRQTVQEVCERDGIKCACIRCREVKGTSRGEITLNTFEYEASGGSEFFISFDDKENGALLGFCRLRFPARCLRQEITPSTAMIRELHVYGTATGIVEEITQGTRVQHKGIGRKLMEEAERIARERGKTRMLVISGVGVRGYYKRLGYTQMGPYVGKEL